MEPRRGKEEEELESNYIISTNQRPLNNFKNVKRKKEIKIINYKLNFQKNSNLMEKPSFMIINRKNQTE